MAVESSKDLSLILRWKREKEDPEEEEEDSILSPCRKRIRRIGEEPIQIQIDIEKLPDPLLFEVLYRLPCRSALQFKSVSKRWYSLISHSEFVRRSIHHRHQFSKSHSDPFTLALYYERNILALPFHNSEDCGGDRIDFLDFLPCIERIRKNYPFYIEASYNDLLLIRSEVYLRGICEYCICNPLTKQWITLPHIRLVEGRIRYRIMVGFVCDPYSCDKEQGCINNAYYRYKVVRIYPPTPTKLRLQIFSSDTGKWCDSNLVVSSPGDRILNSFKIKTLQAGVVACNGKLHWVDTDKENMIKGFLVFDPFNDAERLSYIDPPIEFSPKGSVSFGVFQGHLRIFQMFRADPYHFDVWELEDYGNADTWCLKHKVYMKDLVSECSDLVKIAMEIWRGVSFLAFHPTVGEIAFLLFRNYIVLCNMRTKVLKVASRLRHKGKILDGDSLCCLSVPPKSTFVLGQPSWPTPVPPFPLKFE